MRLAIVRYLVVSLVLFYSASCQSEKISIEGWDSKSWITDKDGCQGKRSAQWNAFRDQRHQFLGIEENQLGSLFGYPLNRELMERGQKIYRYSLRNGLTCGGANKVLAIRVSAMHTVTEITEE